LAQADVGVTMDVMIRHLVSNPCQDACGTVSTGRLHDGAEVLRCPGCESEWIEVPDTGSSGSPSGEQAAMQD
jgi:predicted Zn-ribbon and HTH transcriptional regulator